MADNFRFDIAGATLKDCLAIAFCSTRQAVGWRVENREGHCDRIIFYKYESKKMNPFPAPLDKEQIESVITSWLTSVNYGVEPDIDGDCSEGFRVYNESWGHVNREWEAFFAVEPYWLMYGK